METVNINAVELENAVASWKKASKQVSVKLTASEAQDIRIAISSQIIHIWELEGLDYETKKFNADYYQELLKKFLTK
jgi:hypothetical protein